MGSNSATIWSSISTGFANPWSNQDLPRGKSTSDCQFHFLPPSLFENTYPMFAFILQCSKREFTLLQLHMLGLNSHFHCSKREFVLFQKTYPLLWIHISMFKKRFKSTSNTRMLCFHPYFNVKKSIHSVPITYISFLIHISMFKEENSLITCVLIPISMSEKRIYSFRAAFVVAL